MTPRERDIALLTKLVDDDEERLSDEEAKAFPDMLARIHGPQKRFDTLTAPQREWVERAANRLELDVDDDPAERNKLVPLGKYVAPAAVLLNRPLKPPTKRA